MTYTVALVWSATIASSRDDLVLLRLAERAIAGPFDPDASILIDSLHQALESLDDKVGVFGATGTPTVPPMLTMSAPALPGRQGRRRRTYERDGYTYQSCQRVVSGCRSRSSGRRASGDGNGAGGDGPASASAAVVRPGRASHPLRLSQASVHHGQQHAVRGRYSAVSRSVVALRAAMCGR